MKNKVKLLISIILFIGILVIIALLLKKKDIGNETASIKLYEDLIDITVAEYSNNSNEYLCIYIDNIFDPLNKKLLSNEAKSEILNYSKKYNSDIYNMKKEDLISLKKNNNGLKNKNGLCINFSFSSLSYKKSILNVFYYIDNQSSGMQTYVLKYNGNKWDILKTNSELVS